MVFILAAVAFYLLLRFQPPPACPPVVADLPYAAHVEPIHAGPVISVTQGVVRLDSQRADAQTLRARLVEARRLDPALHPGAVDPGWVVFQIDRTVPWRELWPLVKLAAEAGYTRPQFAAVRAAGMSPDERTLP